MFRRMMASAMALTGVAYAQEPAEVTPSTAPGCAPTPTCAVATVPDASGRLTYDPGYFAQFNPQHALDMVNQTPGFSLNGGADRRGFSGAVGNLLIDGLRPSTKSQSLESILQRIPASQVVRIELLRGADVAGDASGQSVLLNIVRTPSAGSGLWRIGGEYNRDIFGPQGEISYSGRSGQFEYGLGLNYYSQFRDQPGRRHYYDAAGVRTLTANTPSPRDFREAILSGNMAMPMLGGRLSANAQVSTHRFHSLSGFYFSDLTTQVARFTDHDNPYEIGLNFDRDLGPWSVELIGLVNRGVYDSDESVLATNTAGTVTSIFTQSVENESGETILRGTVSRSLGSGHRIEIGAEGAFNTLDASLQLTNDTGGGPVALVVPNSNVLVEEQRSEIFANHSWQINDQWAFEARLAREQSTLTFTGDTNQSVELAFVKPSIQISRSFGENNQVRLRLYRDVGQLDFGDFVSAAGITDNLINGGNPDLTPETSWRAEFGADMRFPGNAALNLTLTRHWIQDVNDVVLVAAPGANPGDPPILFDAPGNIGDADAWSLESRLSLPLGAVLPGARITIENTIWETEVTDPVTGQAREISERPEVETEINFRQDISGLKLAWGVSYYKQSQNQTFRFNEIDTYEEGPWVDAFVESTAIDGIRLRLTAANVFDGEIRRQRNFFAPDRSGAFVRLDERQREFNFDPWFIFQVSGSF